MSPTPSKITTVGVVGTGVIGASWVALYLANGLQVIVADPAPDAEQQLKSRLSEMWPSLEKLGLSDEASLKNYRFVGSSISAHGHEIDFVQEARDIPNSDLVKLTVQQNGPENPKIKINLIAEIDQCTRPEVVIASSSSGIPSSQFVGECKHPERILIGHPFNPPHLMPLVEIVPHPGTSQSALEVAIEFYKACGKTPVHIKEEIPGFAANRLQKALLEEAYSLVNRGVLTAEEVDTCVTNSLGIRWATVGPFMGNVFGGGPGGFKHLMEHVGASSQAWGDDMKAHEFHATSETIDRLDASVQDMLRNHPADAAMKERDDLTIEFLSLKKGT